MRYASYVDVLINISTGKKGSKSAIADIARDADMYDRGFHPLRVFIVHIVFERDDVMHNVRSA